MIEPSVERTVTLAFGGELETHNWEEFRDGIIGAAEGGVDTVVLDLSAVTFFDSSAIRALLGARAVLDGRGVALRLGPCSEIVRRVVEVTGIAAHFARPGPE